MAASDKARTETDLLSRLRVGSKLVRAQSIRDLAKSMFNQSKMIQGFTPDTKPGLATQFGVNRAGQTVSQTAHQIHQRIVNTVAGTVHRFSPYFDALPGAVVFTSASAVTATIKLDSYANFPIGSEIEAIQGGDGAVTISPESGVSLFPATPVTAGKGSKITLFKYAANAWVASGNRSSASSATNYFSVLKSTTSSNVTGNGTEYDVPFNAETTDPGGSFASNVFTAPLAGAYFFQTQVRINGITSVADKVEIKIVPSAGITRYARWEETDDLPEDHTYPAQGMIVLAAGATVKVTATVTGEASNVCEVVGASTPIVTSFDGFAMGGG